MTHREDRRGHQRRAQAQEAGDPGSAKRASCGRREEKGAVTGAKKTKMMKSGNTPFVCVLQ